MLFQHFTIYLGLPTGTTIALNANVDYTIADVKAQISDRDGES